MGKYKVGQRVMIVFPATKNVGLLGIVMAPGEVDPYVELRGVLAPRIVYLCRWADGDVCNATQDCLAPVDDPSEPVDVKRDEEITA